MAQTNGNGSHPLIVAFGSLANIATLIVIVTAAIGLSNKLNAIEAHATQNCRSINASIILTLEASRSQARERGREGDLDRTVDRFQRLSENC